MTNLEEDLFGERYHQPINQKAKGNRNELKVTKLISDWTGHEFTRVPRSGGLRWKNRMDICGDVISADPEFKCVFNIETKHVKSLGLNSPILRKNSVVLTYFRQAARDAASAGKIPFLMVRQNGMEKDHYHIFLQANNFYQVKALKELGAQFISETDNHEALIGFDSRKLLSKVSYETLKTILYG